MQIQRRFLDIDYGRSAPRPNAYDELRLRRILMRDRQMVRIELRLSQLLLHLPRLVGYAGQDLLQGLGTRPVYAPVSTQTRVFPDPP